MLHLRPERIKVREASLPLLDETCDRAAIRVFRFPPEERVGGKVGQSSGTSFYNTTKPARAA